jgi:small redox-active disulfide protein 2
MKIEVLGTGCAKCQNLYNVVAQAIGQSGKFVQLEKVEDMNEIMSYGVMSTPALVIDGEVKVTGRVPKLEEILEMIK